MAGPRDFQPPVPDLAEALTELVNLMLATQTVDDLLADLARLAAEVVAPSASCGITMRRDSQAFTVFASDALAAHVDEVQYGQGEGPCLQTLRTGESVAVPDLAADTRWPDYRPHALAYGVRSSLSLPLRSDGDTRGAMNLYASIPGAFTDAVRQRASVLATQATVALTIVTRQAKQTQLTAQLRDALASRTVIDQALGILMYQQRCNADLAFDLLRSASQHQNRKLRDIAVEIVRDAGGAEPHPGPFRDPG
jgi:GAF domain-containing protein